MRYIINILAATLLLAACTKTEVTYDAPSEIAFTPVAEGMTKAATDYVGGQLNVFAYTEDGIPYFANEIFTDADEEGTYVGATTQYWPNEKMLKFSGYTGDNVAAQYNGFLLSITGYQQEADNDLMWFFTDVVSAPLSDGEVTGIEPQMHHACAKITINVTGENACQNWPIESVSIVDVATSGTVTFDGSAVEWDSTSSINSVVLNYGDDMTIGTAGAVSAIVIPQAPTTLSVTYNDKTVGDISLDYNSGAAWQAGYHYTYTLNFKNPYKIEFSVLGVDPWGDGGTITMQ